MYSKPPGLTEMTTQELKEFLRLIYKDEVDFPLTAQRIACIGFQYKHSVLINPRTNLQKSDLQMRNVRKTAVRDLLELLELLDLLERFEICSHCKCIVLDTINRIKAGTQGDGFRTGLANY